MATLPMQHNRRYNHFHSLHSCFSSNSSALSAVHLTVQRFICTTELKGPEVLNAKGVGREVLLFSDVLLSSLCGLEPNCLSQIQWQGKGRMKHRLHKRQRHEKQRIEEEALEKSLCLFFMWSAEEKLPVEKWCRKSLFLIEFAALGKSSQPLVSLESFIVFSCGAEFCQENEKCAMQKRFHSFTFFFVCFTNSTSSFLEVYCVE